jgi:hypothetical protein
MFTGSKATEDYQPASSAAESSALVQEVTDLCVAFHPHTDIRLFPQDGEAILFWKSRTAQDWVVTRVSVAPNPKGLRTALEYCSLIFTDEIFARIGRNPFRTRELRLHEKARTQFLEEKSDPVHVDLSELTAVVRPSRANGTGAGILEPNLPNSTASTPENFKALRDYSNYAEDQGQTPKTFATWWSSTGDVPNGYFEIVLRAVPPKPLSLREVMVEAKALVAYTKESLPNTSTTDSVASDLSRSILAKTDKLMGALDSVAARSDMDSVSEFQVRMSELSGQSAQIASDIEAFRTRVRQSLDTSESAKLDEAGDRFQNLSRILPKVPHPNPFAAQKAASSGNSIQATAPRTPSIPKEGGKTGGGFNPVLIAVPVLLAAGAGYFILNKPGGTPADIKKPTPSATAKASNGTVKSNGNTTADPVKTLLTAKESAVLAGAKGSAKKEAKAEALKSGALADAQIDQITFEAIRAEYRKQLKESDYKKAFESNSAWNYAKFEQGMPKLTLGVRGEAIAGATEGASERKIQALQSANEEQRRQEQRQEQQEEQQREAQARAERQREERQREERRETRRSTPPKTTTRKESKPAASEKPASSKPKPSEGSAKETGL